MIKIQDGELLDYLPSQLKNNTDMICLSHAIKVGTQKLLEYDERITTQIVLDSVPEYILDVLAVELRTPYYEQWMNVETKRQLIKNTLPWYMKAGTPAAVKELIGAVFGGGDVVEWFDMEEGEARPGEFDVTLGTLPTDSTMMSFIGIINAAKNVRSHLRRMLVTLSGPLDGPDLLDGRTEKGKYGIEILYFLTYFADIFFPEYLDINHMRLATSLDFFDTRRYNGRYLHNGEIFRHVWRRYNIGTRIGFDTGYMYTPFKEILQKLIFTVVIPDSEAVAIPKVRHLTDMNFWGSNLYHETYRHNGEIFRHVWRRYNIGTRIGLKPISMHYWGYNLCSTFILNAGFDFWDSHRYDSRQLHNGAIYHKWWRRYNIGNSVFFKTGMHFWYGNDSDGSNSLIIYVGEYRHNKTILREMKRRYNLRLSILSGGGFFFTDNIVNIRNIDISTTFKTNVDMHEAIEFHSTIDFWNRTYYDGHRFHDGEYCHNGGRWDPHVTAVFRMETVKPDEEISRLEIYTHTKNVYLHNGKHIRNGFATYKTIDWREVIA